MFIDKYKKDKNNIFISTKEIDINRNNKIYFYLLPINKIPFIKSIKDKCGILFYDQYPLYKIIFIQKKIMIMIILIIQILHDLLDEIVH